MTNKKTKFIGFRVPDRLYSFLNEFSVENRMDISDLCRNVITYFFMGYLMGEFKMSGLKERFLKKYKEKKT
jgi:predicted GNAT superfamily acetyltransferase